MRADTSREKRGVEMERQKSTGTAAKYRKKNSKTFISKCTKTVQQVFFLGQTTIIYPFEITARNYVL